MTSREYKYLKGAIYTKKFSDGITIHVHGYSAKTLRRIREAEKKYIREANTSPLPNMVFMLPERPMKYEVPAGGFGEYHAPVLIERAHKGVRELVWDASMLSPELVERIKTEYERWQAGKLSVSCICPSDMKMEFKVTERTDDGIKATAENLADWMNLHWGDLGNFAASSPDSIGFLPAPGVRRRRLCDNCGSPGTFKEGNSMCDRCVAELYDENK